MEAAVFVTAMWVLEYHTPPVVAFLKDWVPLLLGIAAVIAGLNAWDRRRTRELIVEMTKPIQPNTNGGVSLPDVHLKLGRMAERMDEVAQGQRRFEATMERRLTKIDNHFDKLDESVRQNTRDRRALVRDVISDRESLAHALEPVGVDLAPSRLVEWMEDQD